MYEENELLFKVKVDENGQLVGISLIDDLGQAIDAQ
jgi:hypothetical protein